MHADIITAETVTATATRRPDGDRTRTAKARDIQRRKARHEKRGHNSTRSGRRAAARD